MSASKRLRGMVPATLLVLLALPTGCASAGSTVPATSEGASVVPTASAEPTATTPSTTEAPDPSATASLEPVSVHITGLDNLGGGSIEVRAFVASYIGDGTCITRLVDASGAATEYEQEAMPDASSTICRTQSIDGLAAGTYEVSVRFTNSTHSGESEAEQLDVSE